MRAWSTFTACICVWVCEKCTAGDKFGLKLQWQWNDNGENSQTEINKQIKPFPFAFRKFTNLLFAVWSIVKAVKCFTIKSYFDSSLLDFFFAFWPHFILYTVRVCISQNSGIFWYELQHSPFTIRPILFLASIYSPWTKEIYIKEKSKIYLANAYTQLLLTIILIS